MKKLFALTMAVVLCFLLSACEGKKEIDGSETAAETIAEAQPASKDFPYIGTWADDEGTMYLQLQDGGTASLKTLMTISFSHDEDGTTKSFIDNRVSTFSFSWSLKNKNVVIQGDSTYSPSMENGQYYLSSDSLRLHRVGGLDFEIPLSNSTEESSMPSHAGKPIGY